MKRFASAAVVLALAISAAAPAQSRALGIDVKHSKLTVRVHKQGMFSFLADDHEIDAPITNGSFDATNKSISLTVEASEMRVMDPHLPEQKREAVQANMTGPHVLDVATYPSIAFHSSSVNDTDPLHWTVTGALELHGETHPVTLHVTKIDATHFKGSATVRQSAFGIAPIKIAGGAVSVKDDVNVDFDIVLAQ